MGYADPSTIQQRLISIGRLTTLCLLTEICVAVTPEVPDPLPATPAETAKPGYHTGNFRIRPSLSVSHSHDSNIFTTDTDKRDDWITRFSPQLKIDSTWQRHSLRLKTGADIGHYATYQSEKYLDSWIDVAGRLDLPHAHQLHVAFGTANDHEERDSPDERRGGLEPTRFKKRHANMGLKGRSGDLRYRMGVTYEKLDYENTPSRGTDIFNADRDRELFGVGIRLARPLDDGKEIFAQLLYDQRDYDLTEDQYGFAHSSDGYRANVGLKTLFGSGSEAEAYVGVIRQDYDDARFDPLEAIDFGGRLSFVSDQGTTLELRLQRSLNETTEIGSAGYLDTRLSANLQSSLTPRLTASFDLAYGESDYLDSDREEQNFEATVAVKYFLTRNVYLRVGTSYAQRDANRDSLVGNNDGFEKRVMFLALTGQFYPL